MNCTQAQSYVQDLAEGQLGEVVARDLHRHLNDCSDCRVAKQRAVRLQQLLSVKRHETPGTHYFDGFLHTFHRQLAAETMPELTLWERLLAQFHVQGQPVLRYGLAHACGIFIACGLIVRGLISADVGGHVSTAEALSFGAPNLQTVSSLPAPHSTPRRIASTLPRQPEPTAMAGGALIIPVVTRGEPNASRYVLDRISLSPASYEVASIHF